MNIELRSYEQSTMILGVIHIIIMCTQNPKMLPPPPPPPILYRKNCTFYKECALWRDTPPLGADVLCE